MKSFRPSIVVTGMGTSSTTSCLFGFFFLLYFNFLLLQWSVLVINFFLENHAFHRDPHDCSFCLWLFPPLLPKNLLFGLFISLTASVPNLRADAMVYKLYSGVEKGQAGKSLSLFIPFNRVALLFSTITCEIFI